MNKNPMTLILLAAVMATACGPSKVKEQPVEEVQTQQSSATTPSGDDEDDGLEGLEPNYSFLIDLGHYDSVTGQRVMEWSPKDSLGNPLTFQADRLFKVRINSGQAGPVNTTGYGNAAVNYGCAQFKVTAVGSDIQSAIIRNEAYGTNNYTCPDAPVERTINFSSRLTPGAPAVSLKVSNPLESSKFESCLFTYGGWSGCWMPAWGYPTSPLRTQHTMKSIRVEVFTDRAQID